jgi:multidrug efflux pump subunit AcrA (membrane-fusion protein)
MFAGESPDRLLDALTDLALTSPSSGTFYLSILQTAVKATNAIAGALWSVAEVNYRLEQEVGLVRLGIGTDSQLQAIHEDALECSTKGQASNRIASDVTERSHDGNVYRFFGCRDRDSAYLVIELVHDEGSVAADDEVLIANFMTALSEIARDFRNAQLLQRLEFEDHLWSDFKAILPRLHSSIHLDETAYRIANEGRVFLQCDRLSVTRVQKDKASLLAVSGVASIEKRAKRVRELESLVATVSRSGQSLRYPSNEMEAPQLSDSLQRYLDVSQCELIWILLIATPPSNSEIGSQSDEPFIGALIIEDFTAKDTPKLQQRADLLLEHASIAFRNATEFSTIPLRRLSESLRRWTALFRNYRIKLLAGFAAFLIALFFAVVIPADLNIYASGTIQPVETRHLYAPANGEVVKIYTRHQSQVQTGDPLLEIRSRELELRREELMTLRASSQERLRSIEVARLQNRRTDPSESFNSGELSANESELREVVASQTEQLSILDEMLAALLIRSPINGQVISWDPTETLEHRPVQQGQKLISIAELNGDRKIQLRVLDEDARHVINSNRSSPNGLRVTFSIASEPGVKHSAIVTQIGTTVETVSDDGATLRVDASVDATEMANVRPGATVNARIHCGRSSIGYVWTRRLVDYLFFRFL